MRFFSTSTAFNPRNSLTVPERLAVNKPMGMPVYALGNFRARLRMTLAIALCVVSAVSRAAYAESVEFLGAQFPVRALSPVDHGQIVVEVEGGKWMSASDKVGASVADFYAKHPYLGREMPWESYVQFLVRDLAQENSPLAPLALENSLRSEKLFDGEIEQLLRALESVPEKGSGVVLRGVLSVSSKGNANPQAVCRAITHLDKQGRDTLRAERASYLSTIEEQCRALLIATVRESISTGSFLAAESSIQSFRDVFSGGSEFASLSASLERIRALAEAESRGDIARINATLQMLLTDPIFGQSVEESLPLFARGLAEKKLRNNDPQGAVRALTLFPLARRTPAHHEILLNALEGLSSADVNAFNDINVQRMVWGYASQDPLIRVRYLSLLDSMVATSAIQGDYSTGVHLLAAIREVRPDPSADNDRLRLELSKTALRLGDREGALRIAGGAVTGVPLVFKSYLWVRSNSLTAATVVVLLLGLVAVRIQRVRLAGLANDAGEDEAVIENEVGSEEYFADHMESLQMFSRATKLKATEREYAQLIAIFELNGEPSAHDIKNAYRHAVKECHPDLNRGADGKVNDRFIELTQQYERLLELREQRSKV